MVVLIVTLVISQSLIYFDIYKSFFNDAHAVENNFLTNDIVKGDAKTTIVLLCNISPYETVKLIKNGRVISYLSNYPEYVNLQRGDVIEIDAIQCKGQYPLFIKSVNDNSFPKSWPNKININGKLYRFKVF